MLLVLSFLDCSQQLLTDGMPCRFNYGDLANNVSAFLIHMSLT